MSAPLRLTFAIMLKPKGAVTYAPSGHCTLTLAPSRGQIADFELEGHMTRGVIDEVFIPPGCEENCIGTVFVTTS
jgi:hypothetical protein